ncbi:MAG: lytic transglycosylase domain-containing protein [Bacteroidia bacterium]|nr:MAG: lytic transglycosylase domain-containing protein [Bacteroidia bacterium]
MKTNILILFFFSSLASFDTLAQWDPLAKIESKQELVKPIAPSNTPHQNHKIYKDPKEDFLEDVVGMQGLTAAVFNYTPNRKGYNTIGSIKLEHNNPLISSFVSDYVHKHTRALNNLKRTARPYFDMMDNVLTKNGIPKELKYLAVIESHLNASTVSWAGAVGPWQFMPETGRNMGLIINSFTDQRRDYLKSTWAASKYLNYLYDIYNDWLLVVAAYNCGPGRVNSAIKKSGSKNFWNLQYYLPTESRNHVKKFIATHYIMEDKSTLVSETSVAKKQDRSIAEDQKDLLVSGRYLAKVVAKYINMSMDEFNKLNPDFDKSLADNENYQLILPTDKLAMFIAQKNEILNTSIQTLINPNFAIN